MKKLLCSLSILAGLAFAAQPLAYANDDAQGGESYADSMDAGTDQDMNGSEEGTSEEQGGEEEQAPAEGDQAH